MLLVSFSHPYRGGFFETRVDAEIFAVKLLYGCMLLQPSYRVLFRDVLLGSKHLLGSIRRRNTPRYANQVTRVTDKHFSPSMLL